MDVDVFRVFAADEAVRLVAEPGERQAEDAAETRGRSGVAVADSNITRGLIQGGNGREKAEKGGKQGV